MSDEARAAAIQALQVDMWESGDPPTLEDAIQSVTHALDTFAQARVEAEVKAAVEKEREACAVLLEQVADDQDESDIGERAADAFNKGNRRSMSERLQSWNRVLADAIRAGELS